MSLALQESYGSHIVLQPVSYASHLEWLVLVKRAGLTSSLHLGTTRHHNFEPSDFHQIYDNMDPWHTLVAKLPPVRLGPRLSNEQEFSAMRKRIGSIIVRSSFILHTILITH